jgi:DegV family protein with EDD domain
MANDVKIVTDSAADLSSDTAATLGVDVVPLSIRFGEQEYVDGIELTTERFWELMAESDELPATAAPSPGAFENAFRAAADAGHAAVVCPTISSKISGTYQIAVTAAAAVKGIVDVRVVDTQACTIAQATIVREAARVAGDGRSADEVVAAVENLRSRVHLFGALDTLDNLKKGGRIGAAGAFFGSLLSVKPIVGLVDGEVKAVARARTRSKAIDHLANTILEHGSPKNVVVGHSFAPDLEDLIKRIEPVVKRSDLTIALIGSVVGTHAGPRLLAVSYTD